ncbi:hypothetical protein BJD46_gp65 [Mycobacterium phage Bactobuster]|uniref:Uncharacterized protein n=2 Tax=Pukovnikvirus TaxID=2948873 RepID=A0A127KPL5_9CAUD|nr:hypothetical protein BJD46_gp65 [Mycobacterium phage Bactobuster]YP_010064250.1 hypothetical protein KI247_gp34 [Mycobacterium phage IronMan]AMO44033.1 hypothetical protein SEA_BACTOBUSTER_65 [Mycobacterium phage Bactobuster]APC43215.1 hypothetical protein SEA_JAAN_68 [Mycobacterium phage Jaan]AZS08268.1 hypothetical protein PBI_IRONMAN_67 [Mycobacterium phage IronMan]
MTLYQQIMAVLTRHGAAKDELAEELHALIIELYGPDF